jgi:hypothetical protein
MSGDERKQLLRRAPEAAEVEAEAQGVGQLLLRRRVMWALEDKEVSRAPREAERRQGQGEAPADSGEAAEEPAGVEHEGQRSTRPVYVYASDDTQSYELRLRRVSPSLALLLYRAFLLFSPFIPRVLLRSLGEAICM